MSSRAGTGKAPRMRERVFQGQVLQLAALLGWRTFHARPAQNKRGDWRTPVAGDGKGYPDLTLVRGARIIFAELKTNRGALTQEQKDWLRALRRTSAEVYLWRPRDLDDIHDILQRHYRPSVDAPTSVHGLVLGED